ncbi:hypothetical protein BCR39DRAFT_542036 [Naematelia encephala]|uniref:protein-tyrosine-phosphatase n=1 Tax=Naematelia encephala TaxID=71784 RepID=A0A1Y2AU90_9TREE|nr:hypothetical protein BCR39DRAFT_542036 [Naematelia encephala]
MVRTSGVSLGNQSIISAVDYFTPAQAEMEVEEAEIKKHHHGQKTPPNGVTAFTFTFPPTGSSSTTTQSSSSSSTTHSAIAEASSSSSSPNSSAARRRSAAPTSIPNFPSANEHRIPQPAIPYSPSPSATPPPSSPFRSPTATPPHHHHPPRQAPIPPQPFFPGPSGAPSPWHALAASSGAPTPSLDGPGRSSPHLGYPFERLNIDGSWSGGNLWGDGAQGRRASADPQVASPGMSPMGPIHAGMSREHLAKYKNLHKAKGKDENESMETQHSTKPPLPANLARRRASLSKASTLSPPLAHTAKSPSPLASSTTSPSPGPSHIQPISPAALQPLLSLPSTLILDLRAPSAFQYAHLPSALSLSVPSTLLRRPAFSLEKLVAMLSPPASTEVGKWREKSDIVLIDGDAGSAPETGILHGLASKFQREEFSGKVWFLKGGQKAAEVSGLEMVSDLDVAAVEPEVQQNGGLVGGRLTKLAFQSASTKHKRPTGLQLPPTNPGLNIQANPFASLPTTTSTERPPRGGDMSMSSLATSVHSSSQGSPVKLQPANPFFDNIRQNLELSHGGITERIPLALSTVVTRRAHELPPWLAELVTMSEKEQMDRLADEFYHIELGEQKRLQAVMDWHSQGSGVAIPSTVLSHLKGGEESDNGGEVHSFHGDFPFSITAGVERGTKNRYKNIWPYEYSRVRLDTPCDDDSDYINASFVQPRGTSRRYIATQGPLDATYRDFWTLVWEQHVRVIVMLTKQYEGGLLKCGNYWEDQHYGHIKIHLISESGGKDTAPAPQQTSGFDFGFAGAAPSTPISHADAENIRRVFVISHDRYPSESRTIIQIQCTSWPDFDVPESPEVLLALMRDVDNAQEEMCGTELEDYGRAEQPPVLVHCSAGVGRTGSFIVTDAIADGLKRERKLARRHSAESSELSSAASVSRFGDNDANGSGSSVRPGAVPIPGAQGSSPQTSVFASVMTSTPGSSSLLGSGSSFLDAKHGEKMDLDSAPKVDDRFSRHRGSTVESIESEHGPDRRPSLTSAFGSSEKSAFGSSEKLPTDGLHKDLGRAMPITKSSARHRTPSPLSEIEGSPIATVLESMRVQRMSLVQSLRQYLFVHRVIVHHYLAMIDEEAAAASDELHVKRRASPTGGARLTKRSSFKKMRPAGMEGISTTSPSSPSGKVRTRSKLASSAEPDNM